MNVNEDNIYKFGYFYAYSKNRDEIAFVSDDETYEYICCCIAKLLDNTLDKDQVLNVIRCYKESK